jgi:tripartite ATP-independent transporter DctM subunit
MFPALFALVALGIPIGFALIVTAAAFALPVFGELTGRQMFGKLAELSSSFAFAAVPAFILMGNILEKSGIAERLFAAMQLWLGRLPGGLAVATIAMAAVFAATTGIIGAVEVVIGLMAIPAMLARGYDKPLIAGTIAAGGSLGTIIPPSITAVIYGLTAQVPVSSLFAGILLPGLLMTALFVAAIVLNALRNPAAAPPVQIEATLGERLRISAAAILPAVLLVGAVLGAILFGIASPTEAAGTGALGALLLAAANRRLSWPMLRDALSGTATVTGMILTIVFGGSLFASIFTLHGGGTLVAALVDGLDLAPLGLVLLLLVVVFLLGFVLDWATIVLVCMPVFAPLLAAERVDPIWFGVLMLTCIQTSYLTPPMAPAIFYVQAVADGRITYGQIVRGVLPFLACQVITLAAVLAFPALATWLPEALRRY